MYGSIHAWQAAFEEMKPILASVYDAEIRRLFQWHLEEMILSLQVAHLVYGARASGLISRLMAQC